MSYCCCQTSQQQCKPHYERKETDLSLHLFSACPTAQLSASKSLDVLQHPATAGVKHLKIKQKAIRTLGLPQHSSSALQLGFMAENLCLNPRDFYLCLPQRVVWSCYLSHSLTSQVFQLFTMQAHCNWKNLKRNIKLIVPSPSASLTVSVHTPQTLQAYGIYSL